MKNRERTLLTGIFLFWFSLYTYPSFLATYAEHALGASSVVVGLIVGSYGFTQMALRIPLGILSDVTRKRKVFVIMGFCTSMLASAGLAVVSMLENGQDPRLAIAALILRGVSGAAAASWVTFSVLYSANYPPERTAEAMSRIAMPQYLSQVVAMLLGAQIMNAFGAAWAFLLATLAGLAGILVLLRVSDIPPQEGSRFTFGSFLSVSRDRNLILGALLAILFQLVSWSTVLGFVQNWARAYVDGFTDAHLGWLPVMYLIPNAVVARFGGRIAARFGRRWVLAGGFAVVGAACLAYPVARTLVTLALTQIVFGVGMGMIMPLTMASAIETIPGERRGAAMGIYQAVYGVGMFLGPVIAGGMIEKFSDASGALAGYQANFRLCAGIAFVGALTAVAFVRKVIR